jgi:hypothetical protein
MDRSLYNLQTRNYFTCIDEWFANTLNVCNDLALLVSSPICKLLEPFYKKFLYTNNDRRQFALETLDNLTVKLGHVMELELRRRASSMMCFISSHVVPVMREVGGTPISEQELSEHLEWPGRTDKLER